MLAFRRQHWTHFPDLLERGQRATMAGMTYLPAHFALALLAPPARPRLPRQSIGRRRLGRVGGIHLACRQLPLQIGNLLLGVSDLLLGVGNLLLGVGNLLLALDYFPPEILVLS